MGKHNSGKILFGFLFAAVFLTAACEISFEQPTINYNSFELLELPGEFTRLLVNADITNNDSREADIEEVVFTVTIEGIVSEEMTYSDPINLESGETKTVDMLLDFRTEDAAALLVLLDNDAELNYTVTGTITADTALGLMDLDLDTGGTAVVEVDIDDYFLQPDIDVQTVVYNGGIPTILTSSMTFGIGAEICNNDSHAATFKSAEYTVMLEGGLTSSPADYDPADFAIAASGDPGDTVVRTDLTASFPVTAGNLAAMITLAGSVGSEIAYSISGTMTLTADIGDGPLDFILPLAVEGTTVLAPSF
ncbi:MAG: hypothetical protein JW874_01785 [Spirochaetales bacterium]|nr:hypothetical protein [Spirochaetales bacterium]